MKNTVHSILLFALVIMLVTQRLDAQSKYLYVIAIDSAIAELSAFKQPTGFYDIERLKSVNKPDLDEKSERFQNLKLLLDEIESISIRTFIRRLPDGIRTLHTRRGTEESVEHLQRQYIIEVQSPITEPQKSRLLDKYKRIQGIEKDPVI
jgi:hypothetical protein